MGEFLGVAAAQDGVVGDEGGLQAGGDIFHRPLPFLPPESIQTADEALQTVSNLRR